MHITSRCVEMMPSAFWKYMKKDALIRMRVYKYNRLHPTSRVCTACTPSLECLWNVNSLEYACVISAADNILRFLAQIRWHARTWGGLPVTRKLHHARYVTDDERVTTIAVCNRGCRNSQADHYSPARHVPRSWFTCSSTSDSAH